MTRVYVFNNAVAEVQGGRVKIVIEEPYELMELSLFRNMADSLVLRESVVSLKEMIAGGLDGNVTLASRGKPLRIGGGFAQLEEPSRRLSLVRRGVNAPRMPLTLDISAGLLDEEWEEPIQMMAGEAVEIVRMMDNVLYYPCLMQDERIQYEAEIVAKALEAEGVHIEETKGLLSELVPLNTSVEEVRYMNKVYRGLGLAFEYEDASLELVGLLQVFTGGMRFRYAFGEVISGKLLKNEVLCVDLVSRHVDVWYMLELEREASFEEELEKSNGFTSKAALIAMSLGLVPNGLTSEKWDVIL